MEQVCQLCSQVISNEYFYINGSTCASNSIQILNLLDMCFPDLDVNVSPESKICCNCLMHVQIFYQFKKNLKQTKSLFNKNHTVEDICLVKNGSEIDLQEFYEINDSSYSENFEVELEEADDLKVEIFSDNESSNNIIEKSQSFHNLVLKNENAFEQNDVNFMYPVLLSEDNTSEIKDLENNTDNSEKVDSVMSLVEHITNSKKKTRNIKRPYKCCNCEFKSDSRSSLQMHLRIHTGEKPFHCKICDYKAKRKAHLDDHLKLHTGERPYKCPTCKKCFITKHILKNHSLIHTGEKPYRCSKCNFTSRSRFSVVSHIRKEHFDIKKISDAFQTVCYICGKTLSGPLSLKTHLKVHDKTRSHLCELCGGHFRDKATLQNHLKIHSKEKPFKCDKCDYLATRKAHLQDHMRTHVTCMELVQCNICSKRYPTKLLLKKHQREHEVEVNS